MSGQISETPVLTELSETLSRAVDAESTARARLHLLDWLGCAVAGAVEPAGRILIERNLAGPGDLSFAWGGLGNILEMDDVDKRALLHPGPCIIPAALVAAQARTVDKASLLSAIVRGYEATIRLGRAVGASHYAMWHSTGTCGAIGAAAASASLLSLNENQTAHALALALSQSAGLWHTRHDADSMGKQLHTASAARAGLESAFLAREGFKGPLTIVEGEQGFFAAMCPGGDATAVLKNLGNSWLIHDVSFKPWPACRHAHAAIDAALILREQVDLEDVCALTVRTYADALKFCDRAQPATEIEAKFSLQHSVAVSLLRGAPVLPDFNLASINDPEISSLRDKVRVEIGTTYEDRYPARFGAELSCGDQNVRIEDALGDPENPMTENQIRQKADMLFAAGGLNANRSAQLSEKVMQVEGSVADFVGLISEAIK